MQNILQNATNFTNAAISSIDLCKSQNTLKLPSEIIHSGTHTNRAPDALTVE